jgi:hypothetical protein
LAIDFEEPRVSYDFLTVRLASRRSIMVFNLLSLVGNDPVEAGDWRRHSYTEFLHEDKAPQGGKQ